MKKLFLLLCAVWTLCAASQEAVTPIDVEVGWIQVETMGAGRIFYMLFDGGESGKGFVFPCLLQTGETDVQPGKTYVYPGEMDPIYAYWMLEDYWTHALYTEATFCKTVLEDDRWHIDATVTDTNGDSFVLTYEDPEQEQALERVYGRQAGGRARKILLNGRIVIERNGEQYDMIGKRL